MKSLEFRRHALTSATFALLVGCGWSRPPIDASGAVPQSLTVSTPAERSRSWMLPEAKSGDLLYAAAPPNTVILSYPRGELLGTIKNVWGSMCSDANGNVFMAGGGLGSDEIYEYAHGGTSPIAMLSVPSEYGLAGCAIDPTTGNLAASGGHLGASGGVVAIFQNAQGNPQIYINQNADQFYYCGYDNKGNLFANGIPVGSKHFIFSELPKASSAFTDIQLPPSVVQPIGAIQWDGTYITDENPAPTFIYRISVTGSVGTIVGTTQIDNQTRLKHGPLGTWIQGNRVIAPQGSRISNLAYWNYPAGGSPVKIIKGLLSRRVRHKFFYITVSVAPSLHLTAKKRD